MKLALVTLMAALPALAEPKPIRGFAPEQLAAQHQRERGARAIPDPARISTYMKRITREPHAAGSPGARAVAEYANGLFREWGLESTIETFEGLLPYPTQRVLEMTAPVRYRARLHEPALDGQPSGLGQLPPFNAYSASGDVSGELVYVNYGLPEDYAYLKRVGIDVRGKIALARYGESWRGTKVKVAQEMGALACILYSDPRDDGYYQGDVYPRGAFRPPQGAQRGSVIDMPLYVGDPLSPGWASEKGSLRLSRDDAANIMKIPAIPISYADAQPLLEKIGGAVAPESWRGALGITYHLGPGPATVRLKVDYDWANRPLYNVITSIPGSTWPDQWLIHGNHHDAWVHGATDPASAASALIETARTLTVLQKQGWRPKRTIKLALWDGEEFGLIGSTEWAERHKVELDRKAILYLNSDSNGSGPFMAAGSPPLEQFIAEVLRDNSDPLTGRSLLRRNVEMTTPELRLGSLGAGSDYVAFLHHLGISSLHLGFGAEASAGIYHSAYDTIDWFERFSDSHYVYGKALSQVMTTVLLRMADAPVLPFEFGALARAMRTCVDEAQRSMGRDGASFRWRELSSEVNQLSIRAKIYEEELSKRMNRLGGASPELLGKLNRALFRSERALTSPSGLPGRPWYRHQMYAPGVYAGYGAQSLPGIRDAVEAGRWNEAAEQVRLLAGTVRELNSDLDSILELMGNIR